MHCPGSRWPWRSRGGGLCTRKVATWRGGERGGGRPARKFGSFSTFQQGTQWTVVSDASCRWRCSKYQHFHSWCESICVKVKMSKHLGNPNSSLSPFKNVVFLRNRKVCREFTLLKDVFSCTKQLQLSCTVQSAPSHGLCLLPSCMITKLITKYDY